MLAELVTELGRGHLVESGKQRVEVAEVTDQLRCGLLADTGHAGDVVGRIALEGLVVDHLIGPQPEPLLDPGDVVHHGVLDPGPGRHQPDARAHELEHVEIDGDDRRLEIVAIVELVGDRADHVVRLVAGHLVDREAERLDDLADLRELVAEVVRHLRPGRLVVGVLLVAEGRAGEVERDRDVVRLEILDPAEDDAGEAERAVDEVALGGRQRGERKVSAIDEPVAVQQHQAFGGHRLSLPVGPTGAARADGDQPGAGPRRRLATSRIRPSTIAPPNTTFESEGPPVLPVTVNVPTCPSA